MARTEYMALGTLPENCLKQYPSGRWGFVGRVDGRLAYVRKDGGAPTEADLKNAAHAGPRIAGLVSRAWDTKEEAEAAAAALLRFDALTEEIRETEGFLAWHPDHNGDAQRRLDALRAQLAEVSK